MRAIDRAGNVDSSPARRSFVIDAATNRAILKPAEPLVRGATYTATVTTGVEDAAGNPLAKTKTWRFKIR